MADAEVPKVEITYPTGFASAAKGGRRSRSGDDDSAPARDSASVDQVPPQQRRQGEEVWTGPQVRLPCVLPPGRDPRQLQHAFCTGFVMPLFQCAMPSRYHSIHENDVARAMSVSRSRRSSRLPNAKAPGSCGEDSPGTRRWNRSSWRATAMRCEQEDAAEREQWLTLRRRQSVVSFKTTPSEPAGDVDPLTPEDILVARAEKIG